ncbi:patatin-like phospholipase family protein [Bacteroidota bacterium]
MIILVTASCAKKFMVVENPPTQPPARVLEKAPRVALVLGGGAFHGMAHVGVLQILEHANIPIDLIVGTSAGSMVGALYADYPHIDSLVPLVNATTEKDVFDFSLFRSSEGFVSGKRLQSYLSENLHHTNIEDLPIPYVAVTTDMMKGRSTALAAGPIAPSVNASCAIPYIFEPVKMYGTIFSDGGVLDAVATDVAKAYHPQVIIAVDVMAYYDTVPVFKNKRQVLLRAYTAAAHKLKEERLPLADILIEPDLTGMPLMSSKDNEKMFNAGKKAAKDALPAIRKILIEKGIIK